VSLASPFGKRLLQRVIPGVAGQRRMAVNLESHIGLLSRLLFWRAG